MGIITKRGDEGKTDLIGEKVWKDDERVDFIGTVDELMSYLCLAYVKTDVPFLLETQKVLFSINSSVASSSKICLSNEISMLEEQIKIVERKLKPLHRFILLKGSKESAVLFITRAISRRAERKATSLLRKRIISQDVLIYLNRLSDYLFLLARYENKKRGIKEDYC